MHLHFGYCASYCWCLHWKSFVVHATTAKNRGTIRSEAFYSLRKLSLTTLLAVISSGAAVSKAALSANSGPFHSDRFLAPLAPPQRWFDRVAALALCRQESAFCGCRAVCRSVASLHRSQISLTLQKSAAVYLRRRHSSPNYCRCGERLESCQAALPLQCWVYVLIRLSRSFPWVSEINDSQILLSFFNYKCNINTKCM